MLKGSVRSCNVVQRLKLLHHVLMCHSVTESSLPASRAEEASTEKVRV